MEKHPVDFTVLEKTEDNSILHHEIEHASWEERDGITQHRWSFPHHLTLTVKVNGSDETVLSIESASGPRASD
jgi:hypothetical protein